MIWWRHEKWRHFLWRHSTINGHVYCIDIHGPEFDFYHNFITNEKKSIKLFLYMRWYSADIHTLFHMCISTFIKGWYTEEAWQRFNGYILRHLHLLCSQNYGIDRERGKLYIWGHNCGVGQLSWKSLYKTFEAFWNEKSCHEVHVSLPKQKVQNRYTGYQHPILLVPYCSEVMS